MKKLTWIVALIIILAGAWWFTSRQAPAPAAGEPIKIGALLHLTGDAAAWGENAQQAIQLAVEELNSGGGISGRPVEVIYEDTAADPKKAVAGFQKLVTVDKVVAILGPLSQTEDVAVTPLVEQTQTPTIVPGYVPLADRHNLSNPLIVWMDAEVEAGRLAQYAFDQGIRRIGVIGTRDSWESTVSNAFADKFEALGGAITIREIVQPQVSDMKASITKVLATKPEVVFLGTYYQFVNSAKVLNDLRYRGELYGIEVDGYLAEETAAFADGLKFIAPDYYETGFTTKFISKYNRSPGLPAGQAYDAANILFSLLKRSIDKADVLSAMEVFSSYDGVSGELKIASDGRPYLPTALFELQSGEIKRLSSLP